MSAGNPFRRSIHQASATSPPAILDPAPSYHESSAESRISKAPVAEDFRTVQVSSLSPSPPHPTSPPQDHGPSRPPDQFGITPHSSGGHLHNPADPKESNDPFSRDMQDGELVRGERHRVDSADMSGLKEQHPRAPQAPPNPFQRTLATMDPSTPPSTRKADAIPARGTAAERGQQRASLDVDAFKRLLMTGNADHLPPGTRQLQPPQFSGPIAENGSSTDTSSVSRQSIFEPIQEVHNETPRTSHEISVSDDDDRTDLAGEGKQKKPPLPRHRHGKLVTARQPQTVSFSDLQFTPATSSPSQSTAPHSPRPLPPTPTARTSSSEFDKPLPPPPIISSAPEDEIEIQEPIVINITSSPSSSSLDISRSDQTATPQKRTPPAPPLARRSSQLRSSTQNRSRSGSSLTLSSQPEESTVPSSPGPQGTQPSQNSNQTHKSPPPPPPARRSTGGHNTSAASSVIDMPMASPSGGSNSRRSTVSLSAMPPGPRTSSRASSIIDHPISDANTMPPPPPPPRRHRASSKASMESTQAVSVSYSQNGSRRSSGEVMRQNQDPSTPGRRASVASESSLRYEYFGAHQDNSSTPSKSEKIDDGASDVTRSMSHDNTQPKPEEQLLQERDILADLSALQKEVEELRSRFARSQ